MNGVRYIIALGYVFLAFAYLLKGKMPKFFAYTVIAAMFHTSTCMVLLYFFLKEFRSKTLNKIRNDLMMAGIILFPVLSKTLFILAAKIPLFEWYFTRTAYAFSEKITLNFTWIFHIVPVIFPLLFFLGNKMFETCEEKTMFRIYATEIPLRFLAFYNAWFGRFARIPQMIQIIFIPYMLTKIQNYKNKKILKIYYIVWYIFYFIYYLLASGGSSIHYQWIF